MISALWQTNCLPLPPPLACPGTVACSWPPMAFAFLCSSAVCAFSEVTNFQGSKVPRLEDSRNPGFQRSKVPGLGFLGSEVLKFQCSGVSGLQNSRQLIDRRVILYLYESIRLYVSVVNCSMLEDMKCLHISYSIYRRRSLKGVKTAYLRTAEPNLIGLVRSPRARSLRELPIDLDREKIPEHSGTSRGNYLAFRPPCIELLFAKCNGLAEFIRLFGLGERWSGFWPFSCRKNKR